MAAALVVGCGRGGSSSLPPTGNSPEPADALTITLQSPAFQDGTSIPRKYTCDGDAISPPLKWLGIPEKAVSLALICEDPDAPRGTWTHWVIYHIPQDVSEIKEGIPKTDQVSLGSGPDSSADQGLNDFGKPGFGGPCPPGGTHRYVFLLYALDSRPVLKPRASKSDLIEAMMGHILAFGRLVGTYSR
jgi:Raf kinase inhibitor-like YbhB/YbcL family protein